MTSCAEMSLESLPQMTGLCSLLRPPHRPQQMTLNTFTKQWWDKPVYPSVHPGSGVGAAWVQPCVPVAILPWLRASSLLYLPSRVLQMFKGPDKDIEFIYTAPSSAVCGVSLDVGGKKEYLIAGVWDLTLPHRVLNCGVESPGP